MKTLGFYKHIMQLRLPSDSAALSNVEYCVQVGKIMIIICGSCSDGGPQGGSALQRRAVSNHDCW